MWSDVVDSGTIIAAERNLTSIPRPPSARVANAVTTLNLTGNRLASCHAFTSLKNLKTLILDKNNLVLLPRDVPRMVAVDTLWCNNNRIEDLPAFMDQVSATFPFLRTLSLMRNPACPGYDDLSVDATEANRKYRLYVIFRMPSLTFLDCSPVSANEREVARRTGRYCVARKPTQSQYHRAPSSPADAAGGLGVADAVARVRESQNGRKNISFLSYNKGAMGGGNREKRGKSTSIRGVRGEKHERGKHSEGNRFIGNDDL